MKSKIMLLRHLVRAWAGFLRPLGRGLARIWHCSFWDRLLLALAVILPFSHLLFTMGDHAPAGVALSAVMSFVVAQFLWEI